MTSNSFCFHTFGGDIGDSMDYVARMDGRRSVEYDGRVLATGRERTNAKRILCLAPSVCMIFGRDMYDLNISKTNRKIASHCFIKKSPYE